MHIFCLGMNHQTAPVYLRERFAFDDRKIGAFLARIGCGSQISSNICEMVILSTCNRVEIYVAAPWVDFESLEVMVAEIHHIPVKEFLPFCYRFVDGSAAEHLLRVAAGLDSLVIGEPQILGQVSKALETAHEHLSAGKLLSILFYAAIRAGKRARSETGIAQNAVSIPSLAVRLAEKSLTDLSQSQISVLGAGEMAELAIEAFRKRSVCKVIVVNRTLERARLLADRWDGEAETFENLPHVLERSDVLITSTSAPHTLVDSSLVRMTMEKRSHRPLVIIDIAVPRDVEASVGEIPNVLLYELDSLQANLDHSIEQRRMEAPKVETILTEELDAYNHYMNSLDLLPLIASLRQKAEIIRQNELKKTLRGLPGLSETERARLEAMTLALVKKILHEPTTRLREEAGGPLGSEYATLVRALFGLGESVNITSQTGQ